MSPKGFERLLQWFGPDTVISANRYLEAHERLARWFYFKGCNRPEDLADEVVDRVAKKLPPPCPDHIALLLGYARMVLLEYRRERIHFDEDCDPGEEPSRIQETALMEVRARCLDDCLGRLGNVDKHLLLEYHQYEPGGKIKHRQAMAEVRHTTLNALRLKVSRLKDVIEECVKRCCQSGDKTGVQ